MKKILKELKRILGFCEFEGCHHLAVRTFYFKQGRKVLSKNLCDDCAWKAYANPEEVMENEENTKGRSHYIDDYFAMRKRGRKRKL